MDLHVSDTVLIMLGILTAGWFVVKLHGVFTGRWGPFEWEFKSDGQTEEPAPAQESKNNTE